MNTQIEAYISRLTENAIELASQGKWEDARHESTLGVRAAIAHGLTDYKIELFELRHCIDKRKLTDRWQPVGLHK